MCPFVRPSVKRGVSPSAAPLLPPRPQRPRPLVVPHVEPPGRAGFGAAAMSMGLEIAGTSLAVLGWLCTIVCCALPMWRVTAFILCEFLLADTP